MLLVHKAFCIYNINLHHTRKCSAQRWQTASLEEISQIHHPHHSNNTFTYTHFTFVCSHASNPILMSNVDSCIEPETSHMHSCLLSCWTPYIPYPLKLICTHFHTCVRCITCLFPL